MRIQISFRAINADGLIRLPFRYPELVQALIYRHLPPRHAEKLHNEGFLFGKRSFKLFTFSRIAGRKVLNKRKGQPFLLFQDRIYLKIASPIEWLLPEFAEILIRKGEVKLGHNTLAIENITVFQPINFTLPLRLRTLSPITIYSTLKTADGRKKTYYYSPKEDEFSLLLSENARKKYELVYKTTKSSQFKLVPIGRVTMHPVIYKGTVIHAWSGHFEAHGDAELLHITYECGLGAKNSQGFGMWEVVK